MQNNQQIQSEEIDKIYIDLISKIDAQKLEMEAEVIYSHINISHFITKIEQIDFNSAILIETTGDRTPRNNANSK